MSNDLEAGRGRGVCCGGWKQGGAGGSLGSLQGLECPTQFSGWPKAPRLTRTASYCPQASSSPNLVLKLEHLDNGGFQTISS